MVEWPRLNQKPTDTGRFPCRHQLAGGVGVRRHAPSRTGYRLPALSTLGELKVVTQELSFSPNMPPCSACAPSAESHELRAG